jgi:hypothetical protein
VSCRPVVFLVEREADAAALRGIGLDATTFAEPMPGGDVVVLPVADELARTAAHTLAESLIATAATVKVVDLSPGRDDGMTVARWLLPARNEDLRGQAKRLIEQIAARHPFIGRVAAGSLDVDRLLLDHLRAHESGRTATEIANGTLGGIGVRREVVGQALDRLITRGAVVRRREVKGRSSTARVYQAVWDKLGQAGTRIGERS